MQLENEALPVENDERTYAPLQLQSRTRIYVTATDPSSLVSPTSQEPRPEQELEAKLAAKLSCLIKLLAAGGEAGAFKGFLPSLITHSSTRANSGGLMAVFEATDPTYRMSRVR